MTWDRATPYHFGVDYTRDDTSLATDEGTLAPVVADLLDIATAAYLQDRSVRRGAPHTDAWRRTLALTVSVRRPAVWQSSPVREPLAELLYWLTEDHWSLQLIEHSSPAAPFQVRLPIDRTEREIALFSGGLDATAGTALLLQDGKSILGVAVETNPQMRRYQSAVASALRGIGSGDLATVAVHLDRRGDRPREDPTRRTRGLVFLTCGWAAARAASRHQLLVLENGVGAINLPYTRAQSGCMMSRAVHPRTLGLASQIFSVLDDAEFHVVNPHLAETKGEMCKRLPANARAAVRASESCDNAAAGRTALYRRCGECGSCLLRRVSLHTADRLVWDPSPYRSDEFPDGPRSHLPEVLWQVARLDDALRRTRSDPRALHREFPELANLPEGSLDTSSILGLYGAYVDEWRAYPHPMVRSFLRDPEMAA